MIGRFLQLAAASALLIASAAKASEPSSSFTVPVSIIDGYVMVDLNLNGEGPFHFMFDTGAGFVVLDPAVRKLALTSTDWGDGSGDGEDKVHWRRTRLRDAQIGELHLGERAVGVLPDDDVRSVFGTYPLSGFIGKPLLDGMAVKLDYVHRQLTFTPAGQFRYSGSGTLLRLVNGYVPGTIDGDEEYFFVDTGTNPGLSLGTIASDEPDLLSKYKVSAPSITDWGFGGPVHTRLARGRLFALGDIKLRDPVLHLSVQKHGELSSDMGRLGWGVLSRFDVIFDTARSRMILERNSNFDAADTIDRLGMWMAQAGQHFVAADVLAGGPADAAGVKPGDTILAIDGAATDGLVLPVVREQLERRSAGDKVKFLLRSGDKQRTVVVTLQDLV